LPSWYMMLSGIVSLLAAGDRSIWVMLARDDGLGRASHSKGKSLDGRRHQANALLWVISDRFRPAGRCPLGSKADMCSAKRDVRFTPKSGHVRCKG
jgi:hypothetical protein